MAVEIHCAAYPMLLPRRFSRQTTACAHPSRAVADESMCNDARAHGDAERSTGLLVQFDPECEYRFPVDHLRRAGAVNMQAEVARQPLDSQIAERDQALRTTFQCGIHHHFE